MAWLLALVAAVGLLVPLGQYLRQPGVAVTSQHVESFNDGVLVFPKAVNVDGPFLTNQYGYYLRPHTAGTITYLISKPAGQGLSLVLWAYLDPASVPGTVTVSYDGGPSLPLSLDPRQARNLPQLPGSPVAATSVLLTISAANRASNDRLVLDQLEWTTYTGAPVAPPSPLAPIGLGLLVAVIAFAVQRPRPWSSSTAAALGAIVALGTAVRLNSLQSFSMSQLDPDAVMYRIYGDRFQWWPPTKGLFCGCYSEREPFFPLATHLAFSILGSSDFHLRVVSSLLSIAAVVMATLAARRLASWPAALAVGGATAANAPLINESVRGLRTELEICLMLLCFLVFERPLLRNRATSGVLGGLTSAAFVLTRTFFVPVVTVAATIGVVARSRSLRQAALPLALALIIPALALAGHRFALYEVPHKVNYAPLHDAQFDVDGYNRWTANVEKFDQGRPLPHPELFPTAAEYYKEGPYSGPPLSTFQYLFVLHTPQELVHDTLAGYVDVWRNTDGFTIPVTAFRSLGPMVDAMIRWLGLAGLLGLVLTARRQPIRLLIPAMILSALAFGTFAYHRELTERYRHTFQSYPLFLTAAAWAAESGLRWVVPRLRAIRPAARLNAREVTPWVAAAGAVVASLIVTRGGVTGFALTSAAVLTAWLAGTAGWLDAAAGIAGLLIVASIGGPRVGTAAAVLAAGGVALRRLDLARLTPPRVIAVVSPFAVAALLGGFGRSGWHPSRAAAEAIGILVAGSLLGATLGAANRIERVAVAFVAAASSLGLLAVLDAAGLVTGIVRAGGAAAVVVALALPVGASLWSRARHHAVLGGLGVCALAAAIALPLLAVCAVGAGAFVAVARCRRRGWPVVAVASTGLLVGLIGVALQPASVPPAWRSYLAATDVTLVQSYGSVPAGVDRLYIYGRRASSQPGYHAALVVDGQTVSDALESQLPAARAGWVTVPLPTSHPRVVSVQVTGAPNPSDRYIEIDGIYGAAEGVSSDLIVSGKSARPELSLDAGYQQGTLLILPGTAAGPFDYGLRLPDYHVSSPFDLPLASPRAGEEQAGASALAGTGTRRLVAAGAALLRAHPVFGTGAGTAGSDLESLSYGSGLTFRTQVIQTGGELGLFGVVGLLVVIAAMVVSVLKASGDRPQRAAVLVVLLAAAIFEAPLAALPSAVAWWLAAGWILSIGPSVGRDPRPADLPDPASASAPA